MPLPTHAPLANCQQLVSRDLDEVRQHGARVFCEHDLQVSGPRQVLDTRLYYRSLRHIGLGRLGYGATVDIDPGRLENFYLMQWPLRGAETIHVDGARVESSPATGTLVSPMQRFHMRHEADTEKLFVRIDSASLAQLATQLAPGDSPDEALCFSPELANRVPAVASLRAMLDWMFDAATWGSLLEQPMVAARIEETFLLTLLQALPHNRPQLLAARPHVAPGFVRRAEEFMASHANEALTVARIAAEAGVGIRSLYAGFRRYRDQSPMEHLRDLRMSRAHAELSRPASPDETVTQVAMRWGFGHMGQFAADYRARFEELPSQTLRRAQGR